MSRFKAGDFVVRTKEFDTARAKCATGEPVRVVSSSGCMLQFSAADGGDGWFDEFFELANQDETTLRRKEIWAQIKNLEKELYEIDNPTYTVNVKIGKEAAEEMIKCWTHMHMMHEWLQPIALQMITSLKSQMEK